MGNLLRMDSYRLFSRGKGFKICLLLAFVFAAVQTPLAVALTSLANMLTEEAPIPVVNTANLSEIIGNPVPVPVALLALLSVNVFFYADMEGGYIKNIAGQMPKRGYSILSRYLVSIAHSLVFMVTAMIANLLGTLPFQRIVADGDILTGVLNFVLKLLLMEAICAILLLVTSSLRNKSLGTVLAVLLGMSLLSLIYTGINFGLGQLGLKNFDLSLYMPDQVLREGSPDTLRAFLVSAVTIGIFLPLSIRVFDKRDVN